MDRLRRLGCRVRSLYGALVPSGVRPTTLHPPALTQQEALGQVEAELAELREAVR
jgi:hypothetical protein